MSRRFRPTDAYVDESIRGRRYVMGCVPYVRNLVLLGRHSSSGKLETTTMTLDPTRPSSVTDQSGESSD